MSAVFLTFPTRSARISAPFLSRLFVLGNRSRLSAFTLIELLTVMAIIGILAAITFGAMTGVKSRAKISLARTELASLAQALEAYKKQYGDYPQTGLSSGTPTATASDTTVEGELFNALLGKYGPKMDKIQGKQFVEAGKFTLQGIDLPTPGNDITVNNAFVDPWGRLYLYYYREPGPTSWSQSSYHLLSTGPDGVLGITINSSTGVITEPPAVVTYADNIYANR